MPGVVTSGPVLLPSVMVARSHRLRAAGILYGIEPGLARQPLSEVERGILAGDYSLGPEVREPGALPVRAARPPARRPLAVLPGDTLLVGTIENLQVDPLGELSRSCASSS
jgi:hypothetical protein